MTAVLVWGLGEVWVLGCPSSSSYDPGKGVGVTSCAGACRRYVHVGNDQLRVSQLGRADQLLQMRFYQSLW